MIEFPHFRRVLRFVAVSLVVGNQPNTGSLAGPVYVAGRRFLCRGDIPNFHNTVEDGLKRLTRRLDSVNSKVDRLLDRVERAQLGRALDALIKALDMPEDLQGGAAPKADFTRWHGGKAFAIGAVFDEIIFLAATTQHSHGEGDAMLEVHRDMKMYFPTAHAALKHHWAARRKYFEKLGNMPAKGIDYLKEMDVLVHGAAAQLEINKRPQTDSYREGFTANAATTTRTSGRSGAGTAGVAGNAMYMVPSARPFLVVRNPKGQVVSQDIAPPQTHPQVAYFVPASSSGPNAVTPVLRRLGPHENGFGYEY